LLRALHHARESPCSGPSLAYHSKVERFRARDLGLRVGFRVGKVERFGARDFWLRLGFRENGKPLLRALPRAREPLLRALPCMPLALFGKTKLKGSGLEISGLRLHGFRES
jgi:hypothetical protein